MKAMLKTIIVVIFTVATSASFATSFGNNDFFTNQHQTSAVSFGGNDFGNFVNSTEVHFGGNDFGN